MFSFVFHEYVNTNDSLLHNVLFRAAGNKNIQKLSNKNTILVCPFVPKLIYKTKTCWLGGSVGCA